MIRLFLILAALAALTGCSYDIQEPFRPYVYRFQAHCIDYDRLWPLHISVEFGEVPEDTAGKARSTSYDRRIYIDKQYWLQADAWEREVLIYHELSHAVLRRGHVDYLSYMLPSNQFSEEFYIEAKDYLIDELFRVEIVPR